MMVIKNICYLYIYKEKKIFFSRNIGIFIIQFNEFNYQIIWNKLNINKYIFIIFLLLSTCIRGIMIIATTTIITTTTTIITITTTTTLYSFVPKCSNLA